MLQLIICEEYPRNVYNPIHSKRRSYFSQLPFLPSTDDDDACET